METNLNLKFENYEEFKNFLKNNIGNYLPEDYMKYHVVDVVNLPKTQYDANEEAICFYDIRVIFDESKAGTPVISLKHLYETYKRHSFKHIVEGLKLMVLKNDECTDDKFILNKDNIISCICVAKDNKDMLSNCPHRNIFDLAIYYMGKQTNKEIDNREFSMGFLITNSHMEKFNTTEEELFNLSQQNNLNNYKIMSFYDAFIKHDEDDLIKNSIVYKLLGENFLKKINLVTSTMSVGGASIMANFDILKKISDKINDDFYIVPVTSGEFCTLPFSETKNIEIIKGTARMFREMLSSLPTDKLSNNIYRYNRKENNIFLYKD